MATTYALNKGTYPQRVLRTVGIYSTGLGFLVVSSKITNQYFNKYGMSALLKNTDELGALGVIWKNWHAIGYYCIGLISYAASKWDYTKNQTAVNNILKLDTFVFSAWSLINLQLMLYKKEHVKDLLWMHVILCGVGGIAALSAIDTKPSQIPRERKILSPYFTLDDVKDWRNTSLLVPHEPIRVGLNVLVGITNKKYFQTSDINKLKTKIGFVYKWYEDIFYFFIHNHHDGEENIYFPWLEKVTEKLPEKISKDHVQLIQMLNEIKDSKEMFDDIFDETAFDENLAKLNKLCVELQYSTIAHLNEEELIVPALLNKHDIQRKDEDAIHDEIIKELGLSGNKIGLPWVVDVMYEWGGDEFVDTFLKKIPASIRLINWMFWDAHYVDNNKNIVQKIQNV